MTIQSRKLSLIEEFLKINDEEIISKVESLIKEENYKRYENTQAPMSMDEFRGMIDQAKRDSEEGRIISHQDLKRKIQSWK
ncbi:MAG: hypothetical protein M3512_09650 [Bacteroidota bacterium]|nr:hypothetical protein [Bacteroidota bacterium]